jgi:hypothetical protein
MLALQFNMTAKAAMKLRNIRLAVHVACMGKNSHTWRIYVVKYEGSLGIDGRKI